MPDGSPIFIGGVNRSGTSLVRQIVGSHPDVAIPPTEFEFFKNLRGSLRSRLNRSEVAEIVGRVAHWPKVAAWEVDELQVLAYALANPSYRGIFSGFLRSYAGKMLKPRFGEKTTSYERNLATLDRWFGRDYVFVHVLRHPLAAFASARWYGRRERPVDPAVWARTWNGSVLTALRESRARDRGYVAIRYEDVVADPAAAAARICAASGLEFDERMLAMADFEQKENSSFDIGAANYVGPIRRDDDVRRAELLDDEERRILLRQCRILGAAIGYDVNDEHSIVHFSPGRLSPRRLRMMSFAAATSADRLRTVGRARRPS